MYMIHFMNFMFTQGTILKVSQVSALLCLMYKSSRVTLIPVMLSIVVRLQCDIYYSLTLLCIMLLSTDMLN